LAANRAGRGSLLLAASTRDGVREAQPVLSGQGLVGVIDHVGLAGAQVRLITDRDFKVSGRFVRFDTKSKERRADAGDQNSARARRGQRPARSSEHRDEGDGTLRRSAEGEKSPSATT
jgi:cell shape-determining protein MreC